MYEKRFVLFLDILGFKKIIDETEKNVEQQNEKIIELIQALKEMTNIVSRMPKETSKIVTQFSDSIVVSFKENDIKEIFVFLKSIQELTVKLANKNILCRGAISYGNIFHTDDFVFGPALVDAYLTESEAAVYPRVIFDKSVIEIMKINYKNNNIKSYGGIRFDSNVESYLKTDLDDKLYVDYFARAAYYFEKKELSEYFDKLRKNIINGQKFKSPGVKAKFSWMKNKYNQIPQDFNNIDKEEELYLKRPDILDFVKKFKSI